jgi:Sucrase/ferredoxin-like
VTIFAGGNKVIEFPRVGLQDAEKVYRDLHGGLLDGVPISGFGASVKTPSNNYGVSHIFVCTHGARDCRCGTMGLGVFNAISNAIANHPVWSKLGIQMGEVAHVGGHKWVIHSIINRVILKLPYRWAANVLVYPRGDWYRQVTVENIPSLLEDVIREDWADHASSNYHWAGRMGLSSLEQKARIKTDFITSIESQ